MGPILSIFAPNTKNIDPKLFPSLFPEVLRKISLTIGKPRVHENWIGHDGLFNKMGNDGTMIADFHRIKNPEDPGSRLPSPSSPDKCIQICPVCANQELRSGTRRLFWKGISWRSLKTSFMRPAPRVLFQTGPFRNWPEIRSKRCWHHSHLRDRSIVPMPSHKHQHQKHLTDFCAKGATEGIYRVGEKIEKKWSLGHKPVVIN